MIILQLPFPPSTNTYWRSVNLPHRPGAKSRPRVLISESGRKYRKDVITLCRAAGVCRSGPLLSDLKIKINLYPPDNRRRDIDNYFKALFDSLEHAGIYKNDSQIKSLYAEFQNKVDGGRLIVQLEPI